MSKTIWGLDLGSNSLGWAVFNSNQKLKPIELIDLGVRIFPKAVEDKTPTPKNQQRRNARLARRTIQRRARRKRRLEHYLTKLGFLPIELASTDCREGILNELGDPYMLRARALDQPVTAYELGRIFLHLVQRRGFLSNRKTRLGRDMLDDPDVLAIINELEGDDENDKELTAFKADISLLNQAITESGARTLGEYLSSFSQHACKRNRHDQHLRTDRQMYRNELREIFTKQSYYHASLTEDVQAEIEHIIFHQRPLKLDDDRVGKCSLESRNKRSFIARIEYQRFRYLQDINNLSYFDPYTEKHIRLSVDDREKLAELLDRSAQISFAKVKKLLGLDRRTAFNLDTGVKKLFGNKTAAAIIEVYPDWLSLTESQRHFLVEDLISFEKKAALKRRLIQFWKLDPITAVNLCMVELEPGYGQVSLKAIKKLLPHLQNGLIFSDARIQAGYEYKKQEIEVLKSLKSPPTLSNPIVNKALHELRRVVNALIKRYGKPSSIRIEMARDLEMNTKRYNSFLTQQSRNAKLNDKATEAYRQVWSEHPQLKLSSYPSRDQKIRYRIWEDQGHRCIYSGISINLETLFSAEIEIDHILPYSQSLDDSYMNKVVCFAKENQYKGQRTPVDAFGSDEYKWEQITQSITRWPKSLTGKRDRFYRGASDLLNRDFIGSQLTDTRYICREAGAYLSTLGVDVSYTRGVMTDWLRHQWMLNDLLGQTDQKERDDHRHHAIDAAVTACIDRSFYQEIVSQAKDIERTRSGLTMKDIYFDSPLTDLKSHLADNLECLVVSHVPQRKISGALHEDTGVGFIEGIGTVYRKRLDNTFGVKRAQRIIDVEVKKLVLNHLSKFDDDPKKAFPVGFSLFHKDKKTLIKRVRVIQSSTDAKKLRKNKLPILDKSGRVFKWFAYGNTHHVEILKKTDQVKAIFITMAEAAARARNNTRSPQTVIQTKFDNDWVFMMALHINDMVKVTINGKEYIHRIQKLNMVNSNLTTRLHTAAKQDDKSQSLEASVGTFIKTYNMRPILVNAIGVIADDKANC